MITKRIFITGGIITFLALVFIAGSVMMCHKSVNSLSEKSTVVIDNNMANVFHIYRIQSDSLGLMGAQILNGVNSSTNIFRPGDTYILDCKVYEIKIVTALRFSGLLAHLYIFKYDPETTRQFVDIGIIQC